MCGRDEKIREANEADSGTGEPFTRQQPKIFDRCPSCGSRSLFVGSGGWLTCSVIGCKEPATGEVIQGLKDRVTSLRTEIALRNDASPRLGREALLLALDRLRIASDAVRRGIQTDITAWWPNRAAEVALLEVRSNEAGNLLAQLASLGVEVPAGEAPHA